jgi:hypothetical protein
MVINHQAASSGQPVIVQAALSNQEEAIKLPLWGWSSTIKLLLVASLSMVNHLDSISRSMKTKHKD